MKKKILFIINPISGGKSKRKLPTIIEKYLDHQKFEFRISFTERVEHAYMLAKAASKEDYEIVVAVGGDGTVNEVSKGILNTKILLGIIPFGSGNGLARTLKIPLNSIKAIQVINQLNTDIIDSATLNSHHFFNMAGAGFDAHISNIFAGNKTRGFLGYVKSTIQELANYKLENYQFEVDGILIERKAFIVSVANSSQYGNEAHIAPRADVKDGLLDLVIVKSFPWYMFPSLVFRMFTKTADQSKFVDYYQCKNLKINRENSGAIHIDGEPRNEQAQLIIKINPLSTSVIVP